MSELDEPIQASWATIGSYILLEGDRPCRVINNTVPRSGKHGGIKHHITAIDVFSGEVVRAILSPTQAVRVPVVTTKVYTCVDVNADNSLFLIDADGSVRKDLKVCPQDQDTLGKRLQELLNTSLDDVRVTVVTAMGCEKVTAVA